MATLRQPTPQQQLLVLALLLALAALVANLLVSCLLGEQWSAAGMAAELQEHMVLQQVQAAAVRQLRHHYPEFLQLLPPLIIVSQQAWYQP